MSAVSAGDEARFVAARSFFLLGAMKCGTTTLYQLLDAHPDVFFSDPKEPIFFEAQYERGLDFYRRRYFGGYGGEAAVGEGRSHHLALPFVPARIHAVLPEARLVALLRDPVDRAFSEWWHQKSHGLERRDFEGALEQNLERLEAGVDFSGEAGARRWREGLYSENSAETHYGLYLDQGYYARAIARYRELFPAEQLEIVFFEDLSRDPLCVARRIWRFLGVSPDAEVADPGARNPAREHLRSPAVARLRRRVKWMPGSSLLRRAAPATLRRRWSRFIRGRPATRPAMKPETERWLLDHFAPHVRELEALTGRDLSAWRTPRPERTRERPEAASAR